MAALSELLGGCRVGSAPPPGKHGGCLPSACTPSPAELTLRSAGQLYQVPGPVCVAPQPLGHEAMPSRSEPINRSFRAPAQTQRQRVAKRHY